MREKMLKIADQLDARAELYRSTFGNDLSAFARSSSYPISTALHEVALVIRKELSAAEKPPETTS